jgi:hypothetical protein
VPDLRSLKAKCARLEVEYGGETILVFYRPGLVTERTQDVLHQLGQDGVFAPLFEELARILITWDLTEDGATVPVTPAAFGRVGIGLVGSVTNAIVRDVARPFWVPEPTIPTPDPTPWSNGSSPAASSAPAPTTSTSSSPPNGRTSTPPTWPDSPTPAIASAGTPGFPASGGP